MGMFDGLIGGIVGAGMVSVVNGIRKTSGLQGVVSEFEKNGLGPTVSSWVGTDPINRLARPVHNVVGRTAAELAAKLVCPQELTQSSRRCYLRPWTSDAERCDSKS